MASDFQLDSKDQVIKTAGVERLEDIGTPLFQYKQFLVYWGSDLGAENRFNLILTPYHASINNLATPVVKTAEKTMKITYTLTEEVNP